MFHIYYTENNVSEKHSNYTIGNSYQGTDKPSSLISEICLAKDSSANSDNFTISNCSFSHIQILNCPYCINKIIIIIYYAYQSVKTHRISRPTMADLTALYEHNKYCHILDIVNNFLNHNK